MPDSRITSPRGLRLLEKARKIASAYPEVGEHIDDFGHTTFRVRDKPFVMMGEDERGVWLNFKVLHETQDFLIQTGRFEKSAYIGQHGWTVLHPQSEPDWAEAADLIDEAYRRVAPKTLLKNLGI